MCWRLSLVLRIIQAAQGLINTADAQAELTQQITGTNVAVEQSQTVMGGWSEKMSRVHAWLEDVKIACFGAFKYLGVMVMPWVVLFQWQAT